MPNEPTEDWYDRETKRDAILKVLRYIIANPAEAQACVGDDVKAHALFEQAGAIDIPEVEGARVVFFDSGEKKLGPGSSVIIELPPSELTGTNPTDDDLLKYVLGNYVHW
jgi:hypothetical protein